MDFSGRVVLVTGGTRGIGRAIAARFAAAGATVVVCGRQEPQDAVGRFVVCDVRDPAQVAELFSGLDRLDVLVNNAGGSPPVDTAGASARFHAAIIDLNLTAALVCAQMAHPLLRATQGSIVNVGSVSGLRPSPGTAAYGAAKAGLINLTRTLAVEWAPEVRVNCVTPGLVETDDAAEHYGGPQGLAAVAATVPLGRMGTPDDVAAACVFLASSEAAYVSGANLVVHGGGERPAFLAAADQTGEQ